MEGKKTCTKCGEEKPRTEFHKHRSQKDGLQSYCKLCIAHYQQENKEAKAEYDRRYRQENKEAKAEYGRRYRQTPNGKSASRKAVQRRRARKKSVTATLTAQEWEDIKAEYNYRCAYCGKYWYELDSVLEQEHVIPLAQGGGYTRENIVPACRECNTKKHARTPEDAGMELIK